jgi:lipopolysaccharide export system protein LptA
VTIDNSDFSKFIRIEDGYVQKHYGSVRARQDSVFFASDTAIKKDNDFTAWYNVNIQQGDSLSIFSDSLFYAGDSLIAYLYENVALIDRKMTLYNDYIIYDAGNKVATYNTPGLLTQGDARLFSKRGTYYSDSGEMYFYDSVRVEHPDFLLKAEKLLFYSKTNRVEFLGPTLITFDDQRIYCEAGYYDIDEKFAHLQQRPQMRRGDELTLADDMYFYGSDSLSILVGDVIYSDSTRRTQSDSLIYNRKLERTRWAGNVYYEDGESTVRGKELLYFNKTGNIVAANRAQFQLSEGQFLEADSTFREKDAEYSEAIGGVIWRDTIERMILYSPKIESQGEQVKTQNGRPLMVFHTEEKDSIFISADQIESKIDTVRLQIDSSSTRLDSSRALTAVGTVRIWSADFSGLCDSLVYLERDSMFRLYFDPVIWSDSSQITGDSIFLFIGNGKIRKMEALGSSMMLEQVFGPLFHQVKSKTMEAFFKNGQIQTLWAIANAEMYYYIQDEDDAFMGLQSSRSGKIKASFDTTAAIQNIKWFSEIEGEIIPIKEVDPAQYRLEGFQWRSEQKPRSKNDLEYDQRLRPYIEGTLRSNWEEDSFQTTIDFPQNKKEVMQFILQYLFLHFW